MKKNMGQTDRIIRVLAAVVFITLYLTGEISGIAAVVLAVLAAVFLATSMMSTCPLYLPFGISTLKKRVHG